METYTLRHAVFCTLERTSSATSKIPLDTSTNRSFGTTRFLPRAQANVLLVVIIGLFKAEVSGGTKLTSAPEVVGLKPQAATRLSHEIDALKFFVHVAAIIGCGFQSGLFKGSPL